MTPSYMDIMHNRHRAVPRHRAVQPFFPTYTLPAVARFAKAPKDNPPAFIPGTNVPAMGDCGCGAPMTPIGSYYESTPNYYRNPVPYLNSDVGAPVPGWGVNPLVAGPPRLGVGATLGERIAQSTISRDISPVYLDRLTAASTPQSGGTVSPGTPTVDSSKGLPWWVIPVGAAGLLAAGTFFATKKGII